MHKNTEDLERMAEFQSAPGREAGRCSVGNEYGRHAMKFQSAPGREAGRCSTARGGGP